LEHGEPVLFNTPKGIICAQQFGAPRGRPVFHFHGQFSSRMEGAYFAAAARDLGLRIIAIDRPGFGRSPFYPWQVQDMAAITTGIADQLEIAEFAVSGISAGAKYALALVLEVPGRARRALLASAFGIASPDQLRRASARVRVAMGLHRNAEWLARPATKAAAFALRHSAGALLTAARPLLTLPERLALANDAIFAITALTLAESSRQGAEGIIWEFRLMTPPWPLQMSHIRVPVDIWHGEDDVIAPMSMAEELAARVPGSHLHRISRAGHVSLLPGHAHAMLARLAARHQWDFPN
jgi:pimeloyl-ACP methyl ester carboxylesterase